MVSVRCNDNLHVFAHPDLNKFSTLSYTTTIFPNFCIWRRSLRSNLGGNDPKKTLKLGRYVMTLQKLYRAILIWQWFNSSTVQALPTEIWGTWKVQRALKWSRKTIPHLVRLHIRAAQIRRFQREFVTLRVVQFVLEKKTKTKKRKENM